MNDDKLLEHYLRANNSTALQKIRPRLSGEGKVTTPMMVAYLSSSMTSCKLRRFRGGGNTWCAKCLRAFINRKHVTTTDQSLCDLGHAPGILMTSDLKDRYRAQLSLNYDSYSFYEHMNMFSSAEGTSRSISGLGNQRTVETSAERCNISEKKRT
ncbi:uncharacterized protein EAF01_004917 [Botrytis porri]|uniref:uncharacterized protein n=1 Tax=Botrytis porri TaxID=87229 RepID=UPI0018FF65EB|nr:uncharacterized protein EAF01_004917 [Botrytis porri]KAF7907330.1 hypothetical protein EAF01_004917 [Botrytis porri]